MFDVACKLVACDTSDDDETQRWSPDRSLNFLTPAPLLLRKVWLLLRIWLLFLQKCWTPTPVRLLLRTWKTYKINYCVNMEKKHKLNSRFCSGFQAKS